MMLAAPFSAQEATVPYMFVVGSCVACGVTFTFNPHWVPSIRVSGRREPVCGTCFERRQAFLESKGLPRERLHPEAYEPEEVA